MHRVRSRASVSRTPFGVTPEGRAVELFTLKNQHGVELRVMSYGGVIISLRVPDRDGRFDDVVLGYDALGSYLDASPYFGAIVGRYANRIACGRFTLDNTPYQLALNDGPHHLHGGPRGLDKVPWSVDPFDLPGRIGLSLACTSPDGDQGFPGALSARVTYTLSDRDELAIDYLATADRPTPVNLTQHTYWNLAGTAAPSVLGHELTVHADRYTPVDATLIPTGELAPVASTPFDFRAPTAIGARIDDDDEQLRHGRGYDHNFVLRGATAGVLTHAARLADPVSGRVLDVHTSEPGLQFYSGNFLDGSITGKSGQVYGPHAGLCLETQHFPDSPNHPHFPSTVLRPGAEFRSRTLLAFSAD